MKKTTITGLIGLLFTSPLLASETPIDADKVIVAASRVHEDIQNIPANIQVISRDEIREINPTSIPQILNQLGGIKVSGNSPGQFNLGSIVDIGSYGEAASSNTLILINGQRITPIDSSAPAWEMIPVESIERIEIIKGGAGVQYGNGATGGAINIVTNESFQNINRVSASYGSFNTQTLNALLQNKLNDTLLKIAANTEHTNGWRDNSGATAYAANARVTKFFGENSVYLDLSGSHRYSESPGGVVGVVGQGNTQAAKWNNVGSFFEGENYGTTIGGITKLFSKVLLETDLSYKTANLTYKEPQTPDNNNSYNRWSLTFSPRLKIDFNKFGDLITGYDFSHAYGSDRKLSNASLIDQSLYAMYRLPIVDSLDFNAGYRHQIENATANDKPSNQLPTGKSTTSANAWDAALNYKLSQTGKLYVKLNQSFRFPNIDDFWGYADPQSFNYDRIFRGALLMPQIDRTYQIGGDFLVGKTKITTSLYHTDTYHQIRYESYNGYNINDPQSIERSGISLSTISPISDKLTVYSNSNLQDVSYTNGQNSGKTAPLAPHLTINARLNYKIDESWSIGSIVNHVGSQHYAGYQDYYNNSSYTSITNFQNKIPAYTVADIYASYKTDKWDGRITIKNMGNSHYATYGGMGFVHITPGSSFSNYGDSYYYYPSDPRSVFASLSYNF